MQGYISPPNKMCSFSRAGSLLDAGETPLVLELGSTPAATCHRIDFCKGCKLPTHFFRLCGILQSDFRTLRLSGLPASETSCLALRKPGQFL